MSVKRRKTKGKPLLLATAGVGLTVSACNGGMKPEVSGNLMPPPMVETELCIDVTPDNALVIVQGVVVADEQCTNTYGSVQIEATADGYEDYSEVIMVDENMTHAFEMTPLEDDSAVQE